MSIQKINAIKREAIWRGYDMKCVYCNMPVAFVDMHVDHFIPESISDEKLEYLKDKGLIPRCYTVTADYNLVASCSLHNTKKGATVFPDAALPIYFKSMRAGVKKTRKYLIERKHKDDVGNAIITLHKYKNRGVYSEEQLVAAVRANDYTEPMIDFLGVKIPEKTVKITIEPALAEFFKDGTLSYYKIFNAIVNDIPKHGVSTRNVQNDAVVINNEAVLRYAVKEGVVNLKTYNRILD